MPASYSSPLFSQVFAFSQGQTWREHFADQIQNQPKKAIGSGVCMVVAMWWIDAKAQDKPYVVTDTAALKKAELIQNGTGTWLDRCANEMTTKMGLTRRGNYNYKDKFSDLKDYVCGMPSRYDLICMGDSSGLSHFFGVYKKSTHDFRMFDPNAGEYKCPFKKGVSIWLDKARSNYSSALSDLWGVVSFTS